MKTKLHVAIDSLGSFNLERKLIFTFTRINVSTTTISSISYFMKFRKKCGEKELSLIILM